MRMTYISYVVTFDDGDMLTLQEALTHYLSVCEREIAKGKTAPFIAHKGTIEEILSKLDAASIEGVREHELWVRSFEESLARSEVRRRAGRSKRALSRASGTDKRARKRKPT
jgi:hypothetical protein